MCDQFFLSANWFNSKSVTIIWNVQKSRSGKFKLIYLYRQLYVYYLYMRPSSTTYHFAF